MRIAVLVVVVCLSALVSPATILAQDASEAELIAQLQGKDSYLARKAAQQLSDGRKVSPDAIRALFVALDDRWISGAARSALLALGPQAALVLGKIVVDEDQGEKARLSALQTLDAIGDDARAALPYATQATQDPSSNVRYWALAVFNELEADDERKVAMNTTMLSDEAADVRSYAVQSLEVLGPKAQSAVPQITKLLDDSAERFYPISNHYYTTRPVCYDAALALAGIGDGAKSELPKLRQMMQDYEDGMARIAAGYAVARLQEDPQAGVEVLTAHLDPKSANGNETEEAVLLLLKLGARARAALPALKRTLQHEDGLIRILSSSAIIEIDPANAEAAVLRLLDDEDSSVIVYAIEDLNNLPKLSNDAIAAFTKVLGKQDDWELDIFFDDAREAAAIALGSRGAQSINALPKLRQLAKEDPDEDVREAAADAIKKIEGGTP